MKRANADGRQTEVLSYPQSIRFSTPRVARPSVAAAAVAPDSA